MGLYVQDRDMPVHAKGQYCMACRGTGHGLRAQAMGKEKAPQH
jgi:hypothetical protein